MSKQIEIEEGARRQHRAVALFAALQCWILKLDGVCIKRKHLARLIGLTRFKSKRSKWLLKDFSDFFEYQQLCVSGPKESLASLYVSRIPLTTMPGGEMSDEERIAACIRKNGPKLGIFRLWQRPNTIKTQSMKEHFAALMPILARTHLTDRVNYDERLLTSYMSLVFTGQMSLRSLTNDLPTEDDDE